ncbi:hypothetical protein HanIR_Chr02g0066171 [Helianthus annuus]|nr:hypothetical protein HanIR_Chr02g0066171 [Helianthus annuus]
MIDIITSHEQQKMQTLIKVHPIIVYLPYDLNILIKLITFCILGGNGNFVWIQ